MPTIPKRPKVGISPIYLRGQSQVEFAVKAIRGVPLDSENPVEVLIREKPRQRGLTLNAAYWAGPLADIARQAWRNDRQYSAEVWHSGMKTLFLPDPDEPDFDPAHVLDPEKYVKWVINPITDQRDCVGSTTQLTDAGMRIYLLKMEAFAAQELGVRFTTRDEPRGR